MTAIFNMKKKIRYFIFLALFFVSFQNPTSLIGEKIRIKRTINLKTGNTTDYIYNRDWKLSYCINSKGRKISYKYLENIVEEHYNSVNNNTLSPVTYYLNKAGFAIEIKRDSSRTLLYLDANNMQIFGRQYVKGNMNMTMKRKIISGNVVVDHQLSLDKTVDVTKFYTYYPTLNTIGNKFKGIAFINKDSKNLLHTSSILNKNGDTVLLSSSKYIFDSFGRVILSITHNAKSSSIDSTSYEYY